MEIVRPWQPMPAAVAVARDLRQRAQLIRLISQCCRTAAQARRARWRRRLAATTRVAAASAMADPPSHGTAPAGQLLTVAVTADDIAAALQDPQLKRQRGQRCPVARAVSRALQVPLGHVCVGPYNLDCEAWHGRGPVEAFLPPQAVAMIAAFDRWRAMQPFVFRVWLRPWGGRRQGTRRPAGGLPRAPAPTA